MWGLGDIIGTWGPGNIGIQGHGDTGIQVYGDGTVQPAAGSRHQHRDQGLGTAVEHWDSALSTGAESEFWVLGTDAGFCELFCTGHRERLQGAGSGRCVLGASSDTSVS